MWHNEKEFVKYLIDKLSSEGAECSRIETPATGVGIPDMFIQGAGDDLFIEAKLSIAFSFIANPKPSPSGSPSSFTIQIHLFSRFFRI